MLDWPEANHTSPTNTSRTVTASPPFSRMLST